MPGTPPRRPARPAAPDGGACSRVPSSRGSPRPPEGTPASAASPPHLGRWRYSGCGGARTPPPRCASGRAVPPWPRRRRRDLPRPGSRRRSRRPYRSTAYRIMASDCAGSVTSARNALPPDRRRDAARRVVVDVHDDDPGPFGREPPARCLADARAPAGDEHHAAIEPSHAGLIRRLRGREPARPLPVREPWVAIPDMLVDSGSATQAARGLGASAGSVRRLSGQAQGL
jgi:hypothetical protein